MTHKKTESQPSTCKEMPASGKRGKLRRAQKGTTQFISRDIERKQKMFNNPIIKHAMKFMGPDRDIYTKIIMDAGSMMTTKTFAANRVNHARTLIFTDSDQDFRNMVLHGPLVNKVKMNSNELYANKANFSSHTIVIHDGWEIADNTIIRITPLLTHGIEYLGLCCNISTRGYYWDFEDKMKALAEKFGYSCKCKWLRSYGHMRPFWFELVKKPSALAY